MANNQRGKLDISSPVFKNEENIPEKYTCDGEEINPPIRIAGVPDGTSTLALIAEDPDAPKGTFDHWLVWNIDLISTIAENSNPGISGTNGAGKTGYHAPCPPSGSHRYYFHVFALDKTLDLPAGADKKALHKAMEQHIIAQGTLMGRYKKKAS